MHRTRERVAMFQTLKLRVTAASLGAAVVTAFLLAAGYQAAGQAPVQAQPSARANPLRVPSPLPFQAPPFDKIQDADFQPALEEGMRQHLAEVNAIADNPAAPNFDN